MEVGRSSSSTRMRTWTATSTSVARRRSVHEHSPSLIACLNLPIAASARARLCSRTPLARLPVMLGDTLQMTVALRGRGLGHLARHGRGPRQHDDSCFRAALGDGGGNALLILGAIGGQWSCYLVERGADLGVSQRGHRVRKDPILSMIYCAAQHRNSPLTHNLHGFETGSELRAGLSKGIGYYNTRRPHSILAAGPASSTARSRPRRRPAPCA